MTSKFTDEQLNRLKKIYWIFGKSCSGKTTAAEYLEKEFGFYHFDGDEMLNRHANNVKSDNNYPVTKKRMNSGYDDFLLSPDEFKKIQNKLVDELTDLLIYDLIDLSHTKKAIVFEGDINYKRFIDYIIPSNVLYINYNETIDINTFNNRDDHNMLDGFTGANIDKKLSDELIENFNSILLSSDKKNADLLYAKENNWHTYERKNTDEVEKMYKFLKSIWVKD